MATITIEVAFALPQRQCLIALEVPAGTTARQAVALAGLEKRFPELPPETFREAELGLFGRRLQEPERQVLRAGDRVEVYRPLTIDPKAARLARAAREKT